ncbi:hypothetical protein [Vibrio mediterranei]|uniref:hypothetical protein n=1 Tax=Vibrio mediterranei TaxID=689 RepID=UPI001EFE3A85|nr:hypothetical protein [Vibrio mediterranei]MCG9658659.1 hypothetical protein [Vibrio mediterranei]
MSQSDYQKRKDYFSDYKKKRREARMSLISVYQEAQSREKSPIGFRAVRVTRKGKVTKLPPYMNRVFKACKELIDNRFRFQRLWDFGGRAINNTRVRRLLARVLVVILARSDLLQGRVGVPGQYGMDTISHHDLMCDYVLRFGENIEESTWNRAVKYLIRAGYLDTQRINISLMDDEGEVLHRSIASYKQFSVEFFDDLKVTLYKNIAQEIYAGRVKQQAQGYQFDWIPFYTLAGRFAAAVNIPKPTYQYVLPGQAPPH